MNRRMIISEIWEDDFFIPLSLLHRLTWIGIITAMADDQGRLQDNAALIRSHVFPSDNVDIQDIEQALILFDMGHKILRYISGDKKLIQVINWWKHQKPTWAARSLYQAPEGWHDRCRYNGPGGKQIMVNWGSEGGFYDNIPDNILPDIPDNIPDRLSLSLSLSKDKVKDKERDAIDPFSYMQHLIEHMIGYPMTQRDIGPINEMIAKGVIEEDIKAALEWLDGKKKIMGAADLAPSAIVSHGKRIQAENKSKIGIEGIHFDNVSHDDK